MAINVTDHVSTAMIIDKRSDRLSLGWFYGLHRDRPVRARDREPFELASRQLWFGVEQRADVAGALPAYRAVATNIEAWNAALAPPALHLSNLRVERCEFLGVHDRLLLAHWLTRSRERQGCRSLSDSIRDQSEVLIKREAFVDLTRASLQRAHSTP